MFKRVTIVALVVAAFLVLAVPALAFNGYREDYTTSDYAPSAIATRQAARQDHREWSETATPTRAGVPTGSPTARLWRLPLLQLRPEQGHTEPDGDQRHHRSSLVDG